MQKTKMDPSMIRVFVEQGLSDQEIAGRMGWTVGTLRVRCSQLKISLKRDLKKVRVKRHAKIRVPLETFDQLRQRADLMGVSADQLAADLLQEIVRDGLYNAVLDRDETAVVREVRFVA